MLRQRIYCLLKSDIPIQLSCNRHFGMNYTLLVNQKWRQERKLPANPNANGVLTDSPDYTFLDGRLTPYGVRQKNRILRQKEVVQDIIKLTSEIDFAVERHKRLQIEEENKKNEILNRKLKPKGVELLKSE